MADSLNRANDNVHASRNKRKRAQVTEELSGRKRLKSEEEDENLKSKDSRHIHKSISQVFRHPNSNRRKQSAPGIEISDLSCCCGSMESAKTPVYTVAAEWYVIAPSRPTSLLTKLGKEYEELLSIEGADVEHVEA